MPKAAISAKKPRQLSLKHETFAAALDEPADEYVEYPAIVTKRSGGYSSILSSEDAQQLAIWLTEAYAPWARSHEMKRAAKTTKKPQGHPHI